MSKKKLIGYYRLSKDDGEPDRESNSITNQRMLVKEYISAREDLAAMEFVELYDDGYSGASMERPAIKKLLVMMRQEEVGCLIVKDFSRFSRDYIELGTYMEHIFPFMQIRFISISDKYDSAEQTGTGRDLESQFKGLIADFYVKDQSQKVKAAYEVKKGAGEYCSGSTPFGYRKNPENKQELMIVEEEAAVIRRVFDLTLQRYSKEDICQLFNDEQLPTPLEMMQKRQKVDVSKIQSGHLIWTVDMIRKILGNKSNYGCMVYGKTKVTEPGTNKEIIVPQKEWKVIENHHEPIISKEIFEQAQMLQIRHSTVAKRNRGNSLLAGYVKCGACRRKLASSREYKGHFQYSCSYAKGVKETDCFTGKLDNKILEQIVLQEVKRHLQRAIDREQMEETFRQQHLDRIKSYEGQIAENVEQQNALKQEHSSNFQKYHTGELTKEEFLEAKKQIERKKAEIQERIRELQEWICEEEKRLEKQ